MASPDPKQPHADGPSVVCETSCPVDFTQLSPSKFGISTESFAIKDKSQRAKIKSRRSAIGARGSPETNALIRFIAQQRAKTPPLLKTPEAVKRSPKVSSTLKEKMASLQCLMEFEEPEHYDPVAITKQDLLDGDLEGDKENCSQRSLPGKRRHAGPPGDCESEISGADSAIFQHPSSQWALEETSFEVQSTGALPMDLRAQRAFPFPSSSSSPGALLETKPFAPANASATRSKKRVRFGGPLSPELFDKNLPPSTPLQKGTTPARAQTPGGAAPSILKTPQRPTGWSPLPQLLFCNPASFGASPTFLLARRCLAQTPENDGEKIVFPSMEEIDSPCIPDTEALMVQPLDLDQAFQEESLAEAPSEPDVQPSEDLQAPPPEEEPPQPPLLEEPGAEGEAAVDALTSSNRPIRKARAEAQPSPSAAPAPDRPVRRKRKQPQETQPVKRSARSAAKSAAGKMKTARRFGSKEVDRSLYGSRDYASRNPALSPIDEGLGCLSPWPAPRPPGTAEHGKDIGQPPAALSSSEEAVPGEGPPVPLPPQRDDDNTTTGSDTAQPSREDPASTSAVLDPEVSASGKKKRGRPRGRKVSVPLLAEDPREQPEARAEGSETASGDGDAQSLQPPAAAQGPAPDEREPGPAAPRPPPEAVPVDGRPEEKAATLDTVREKEKEKEEEEADEALLAPWQRDFLVEDVFMPVVARGQRSVRRSLRNRGNDGEHPPGGEHPLGGEPPGGRRVSGLAWVPRTSPDSLKEIRRRTRGKRLSATPAPQTPLKN